MSKIIILILISFSFGILKMEAQKNEAADEILFKILKAEVALKEEKPLNQEDLKEIVCLTNIETKKGDGNYFGISFFPSDSEIQLWKDWFEKYKARIVYSTSSDLYNKEIYYGKRKVIQVEYEKGKFRNNVCNEDKDLQDWLEKHNSKK